MENIFTTQGHGLIELNHSQFAKAPEAYLQQLNNKWLELVLAIDATDDVQIKNLKEAISQLGQSEQLDFWNHNNQLKHPLEKLIQNAEGGNKVVQLIRELQDTVLKIKPPQRSFWVGFVNMFKLLFSLKESAWHIWLEEYPIYKKQILKVTEQLEFHKRQIKRDNSLFLDYKNELNIHLQKLENSYDMICNLEKKASNEVSHNQKLNTDTRQMLVEEFLPDIQQRLIDLQQQLLIARQSVMTMELFIHQNESQIKGIDHTVKTTAAAVEVTASIFVLKQARDSTEKLGYSEITNKAANKTTVDKQKLKRARHLIDQALSEMEETRSLSDHTSNKNSKDD